MLNLSDPVSALPKIGPKYKQLLEKLDIHNIHDLLYHFPFRYEDFSQILNISDLKTGEKATVQAVLGPVQNIYTKYGKRLTLAKAVDHTGELTLVWFNQHYIKSTLTTGATYNICGTPALFSKKLSIVSPSMEESSRVGESENFSSLNTGRIVPVYAETYGVSSKYLRSRINDVISRVEGAEVINEFLPKEILNKFGFPEFYQSLKQIHFPDSFEQAEISRKRFGFEEMFKELLIVEHRKRQWHSGSKAPKMKPHKSLATFIHDLPFKLTASQDAALQQIIKDLQQAIPMNRLLEGDVGTGKTVVAAAAAYFAHLNGYKVLYMAPTEILAQQHTQTFEEFLAKHGLKIGVLTAGTKNKVNDWDILIGTHAMLFAPENYKDIGLVIIDEQHRFGVEQRGKLMELGRKANAPHFLSMTATPIPRTLALTMFGDLSISSLKTHPNALRKITTKVVPESARTKAYEWIKSKNEPAFIVCPFIEESESVMFEDVKAVEKHFKELAAGVFKGVKMGMLHGRMKAAEKAEVIANFRRGEFKVLVATPVIEVGIDIPDATIIVIESAERYGLASLHQLRGRVGRGDKEGFCFVFMSNNSKTAYTRLKNLEKIDNGLELAEVDLQLRGAGDLFGTMQSGFKRFKVADFSNLKMLEDAKEAAEFYFDKLGDFPKLGSWLKDEFNVLVKGN